MGTIRKRGNTYYIDFYVNGKRYRRAVGKNKKDAIEALRAIEGEIARGKFNLPSKKKIRFKEFAQLWLETHSKIKNKPSSYQTNCFRLNKHLIPFFGNKYLDTISPLMIDEFISKKKLEISSATINRCLSILSKIFNDAIRWGYLKENPMKNVSRLNEPEKGFNYLTKEQVKKLLENASPSARPILMLAVYTGMRKGEILALKWEHINFEKKIIKVEETPEGSIKSKKVRYIPIHPDLLIELKKLKLKSRSEYVFPAEDGGMRKDFRNALNYALKRAGLPKIRIHDLRHTFAANFIMAGGNILTLQKILGHSDLKMTMRYAHLAPDFFHQEIEKMNFMENPVSLSEDKVQINSKDLGLISTSKENFGHNLVTNETSEGCEGNNKEKENLYKSIILMVAGDGIEPPTRGFSVRCSTD